MQGVGNDISFETARKDDCLELLLYNPLAWISTNNIQHHKVVPSRVNEMECCNIERKVDHTLLCGLCDTVNYVVSHLSQYL